MTVRTDLASRISLLVFSLLGNVGWLAVAPAHAGECGGAEVRLDDEPGDPLFGAAVQSQDGLGTCASNALALLLQAQLPGHPAVSFLDLAFHDPDMKDRAIVPLGQIDPFASKKRRNNEVLAFWGAHVGEQFYQARSEAGGVCPRDKVPLESSRGVASTDPWLIMDSTLRKVLEATGRIFDSRTATSIDLAETVGEVLSMRDQLKGEHCGPPRPGTGLLREGLLAEAEKRRRESKQGIPSDQEIDARVTAFIERVTAGLNGVADVPEWFKENDSRLSAEFRRDFGSVLPSKETARIMFELEAIMGLENRFDPVACAQITWLRVPGALDEARSGGSCTDSTLHRPVVDLVSSVLELGWDLDETVRRVSSGTLSSSPTEFYEKWVAPDCAASRIPISSEIFCGADWMASASAMDRSSPKWKKEQEGIHSAFEKRIGEGSPLALSICAEVLKDFSNDSANGLSGCPNPESDEHSSHALVAIGYRDAPDGSGGCRREILLQNSWGLDWCAAHGELCKDGKLWIPEESLARNLIRMDSFKKLAR